MRRIMDSKETVLSAAKGFINFLNKSPSPFHAVDESRKLLLSAGFKEIREADKWDVKPLDKLFFTRNQSTLIAFAVGGKFEPGNGFSMIGTHTDSPCLKVKPVSKINKQGYLQVGVQLYGGGIWHSWFDRDLKLAGRVIVKDQSGALEHKLVHIDRPIMRIPNVAIHLHREQNEKFEFNKETHLAPVLATVVKDQLEGGGMSTGEEKHHPAFLKVVAKDLKVETKDIMDFELCLADHVPATLGGLYEEFIFSGRLDNLHSTYCALKGFIDACTGDASLSNETNIRMLSMFDNEEVGSESAMGAASSLQEHVLRRLSRTPDNLNSFEMAIPKSLMVSADMAHAVHPSFADKHEENHKPALHKGVTLKFNANQRYASTAITSSIMREIAKEANVPLQDFVTRNDTACGSTIGPIISSKLGIPTLDLGSVQLSMHSIREMCCTSGVLQACTLFKAFYEKYPTMYSKTAGI